MKADSTVGSPLTVEVQGGTLRLARDGGGPSLSVGAEPRIVGRSAECHLVLADKKVSAAHLELSAGEQGVRVRDLGSTNGTYLGEHRIVEAWLAREATLRCGDTVLYFTPGEPEPVPLSQEQGFGPLVGAAPAMRALFEKIARLAKSQLSILVTGETGTGKELVAQAIHEASPRASKPFVVVDCAAIPASLAESTLFGHERGAFTGAVAKRVSPFVEAHGGTLFLDELGELPLEVQPKLLRVLAEQRVKAVGANSYVPVDVRIVAATRRDILKEVNQGTFRSDLYFRIAQVRVELPPLRERVEDIPAIVARIFEQSEAGDALRRVTPESIERLLRHDWPGNVRELCNVVAVALAYDEGSGGIDLAAHVASIRPEGGAAAAAASGFRKYGEAKREFERAYFGALYEECEGNLTAMGERAGVDRKTIRESLRRLGIGAPK